MTDFLLFFYAKHLDRRTLVMSYKSLCESGKLHKYVFSGRGERVAGD